jgi:glycine cleavage system H protein
MPYPKDYKYTKEHEWIQIKGNTGLVGITEYAQEQLGDIVHVNLPEVGKQLKAEEAFGGIDSVKSFSDLFSPASGKVIEVNDSLTDAPEKVNNDAHSAWMIKLELANPQEADRLMSAEDYEEYVAEEK